mgnify:CR=1 FL=1
MYCVHPRVLSWRAISRRIEWPLRLALGTRHYNLHVRASSYYSTCFFILNVRSMWCGDGPCRMRTRLRMCGGTRPLSFTCEPRPPPSSPGAACLSTRRWPRPLLRVRLIAMGLGLGIGMGFKRRTMPAEELEESMTGTLGPVTYLACYQCSRHPCSNVASTDAV